MKRFLLFFAAAVLFLACDNKFEDGPSVNEEDVTLRFTATCSEDVPHLKWDKGDKMSLFLANTYNNKFVFERAENDNAYFIPEDEKNIGEGDALDRIYAVYPYDTNISVSNNGVISLKLSDVQSYEVDGFDPYYNSAVAVTKSEEDRVLNFKGIYGYVTIPLYGDATVESVEIRGNNGEKIAGDITILATPTGTPEIYTSERGEESILLDCGDGVTLSTDAENPTEFWFIIPPMRFDSGISLIIHCGEKGDFEPTISKAFVVERNKDISLEAIEVKFKPEVELVNNEIFYTSTDGKIVTPNKSDRFGANITSNTYDDGQGVITFDGEVTKFGDYVFFECDNLETIVIPNSVTSIGKNAFEFCHSLAQVTIPNGVTTLMNGAFYGCTSLESITIPESVTVIEEWTFGDCTMLTSVYCKMATPSSGGIGIFENNAEDRKIYVPVGSGKAYKTANAWKEYAYAIREYDFESGEVIVEDPVLTLTSESEISFSADGGNGEIGYTIENPVEGINVVADSDAEWITNFAVAEDKITFKVAANENKEPRTATITVEYGVLSFNVKITQEGGTIFRLTTNANMSFSADGGDGEIGYTLENPVEGINVVADSDAEWITNFAVAKDKITFKVAANENKEPRTATITVEYGVLSFNVKITQEGGTIFRLTTNANMSFSADGGDGEIGYTLENPVEGINVVADSDAEWITNFAVAKDKITFKVAANENKEPRTATITVEYGVLSFNVKITQEGGTIFRLTTNANMSFSADGGNGEIGYTLENPVEGINVVADSDAEWITNFAVAKDKITFKVAANENKEPRTATITVEYGVLSFNVKITQEGGTIFRLTTNANMSFSADGGNGEIGYTLENPVEGINVVADSDAEWITNFAVAKDKITFKVAANENKEPRTATITVEYGVLSFNVKITQEGGTIFRLTTNANMSFSADGGNGEIGYTLENPVEGINVVADSDAEWITNFAVAEDKITFKVANNTVVEPRTATINVKYGVLSFNVEVAQVGATRLVLNTSDSISSLARGGIIIIGYSIINPIDDAVMTYYNDASWITNVAINDFEIQVNVAENNNTYSRSTYLTFEYIGDSGSAVNVLKVKITQEAKAGQSNNEIWYTSSDGNIVEPYSGPDNNYANTLITFGANIVSNTYNDGKGVITFDDDVTTIGDLAFFDCNSLTSVTIGDSVTTIGEGAFSSCDSLKEFKGKFASDNGRCLIVDGVLNSFANGCGATDYTIPDSVTTIGERAFFYCDSLTSVTIGDSVTTIGSYAFYYCRSLTSVTIGDSVTSIGNSAFRDCYSLTSVTIGDSVTTIGERAFYDCGSLTSVTIGDSVTTIGENAFLYCDSLTSVTIPDSVTSIGDSAFDSCTSLTSVTIGDSVTTIGNWAFASCRSLTSVTVPDSVTTIGEGAFYSCTSLTSVYCKATTPPSLGNNAFKYRSNGYYYYVNIGCTIYVPRGCGSAYKSASYWKDYAADIVEYDFETGKVVPEGQHNNEIWYTSSNGNIVEPYSTNVFGANIVSNNYKDGKGVITFDGNVTTIGYEAFYGCTSLTSVTIPDSVTTIGDYAFRYCTSLTSVTIPDSVTTIGDYAFRYCYSLTSVTIPNSVTTIGDNAFRDCTSLTSVTIPDSVTTIGARAFRYCTSLTSVTIPDSVTTIGDSAFASCDSLTSVTIPDSVTTIGNYAFQSCTSLTSITIGDSVTTIGHSAFFFCTSLTSVYCKATTPPSLGDYAFKYYINSYFNIGCTIYVPRGCGSAYKSATNWNDYAADIVEYDF